MEDTPERLTEVPHVYPNLEEHKRVVQEILKDFAAEVAMVYQRRCSGDAPAPEEQPPHDCLAFQNGYDRAEEDADDADPYSELALQNPFEPGTFEWMGYAEAVYDLTQK